MTTRWERPVTNRVMAALGRDAGLAAMRAYESEAATRAWGEGTALCHEAVDSKLERYGADDEATVPPFRIQAVMELHDDGQRQVYWDNEGVIVIGVQLADTTLPHLAGLRVDQVVAGTAMGVAADLTVGCVTSGCDDDRRWTSIETPDCYETLDECERRTA